jgi:hypothetical protein
MKVSDLIEKLKELDQDKYIVINGYEGGCDFPNFFTKARILLDQNTEWYYGKHDYIFPHDDEYVDGEWNAYTIENNDEN